jgi:hypothetical protein
MKKFLIIISMMLFLVPGLVYALPWSQGDTLTISWGTLYPSYVTSGSGGLATITDTTINQTITTFCIELDEYTSNSQYVYNANTSSAKWGGRNVNIGGEPTPDPLRGSTKWLFAEYKAGVAGYQNIGALTYAIWYMEREYYDKASTAAAFKAWFKLQGGDSGLADIIEGYINDAEAHSTYQNNGILVLNTYNGNETTGQGQSFIFPVPEPGILILLGIAMSAIGMASWRIRKI